jgi:hypothetical protein
MGFLSTTTLNMGVAAFYLLQFPGIRSMFLDGINQIKHSIIDRLIFILPCHLLRRTIILDFCEGSSEAKEWFGLHQNTAGDFKKWAGRGDR